MARVCRRQQCSVERRGFRQELDSWRHKLIHCVGETFARPPPALGPPRRLPPRTWEGAGGEAIAGPPALFDSSAPPPPFPGVRARALRAGSPGLALPGSGLNARACLSARTVPRRAVGRERESFPSPFPHPTPPLQAARRRRRLIVETCPAALPLDPGRCRGSRRSQRGSGGRAGPGLSPVLCSDLRLPPPAPPLPHAQQRRASPTSRARAVGRRAPALRRVRGVRWRWGRREPELSQAPGSPD